MKKTLVAFCALMAMTSVLFADETANAELLRQMQSLQRQMQQMQQDYDKKISELNDRIAELEGQKPADRQKSSSLGNPPVQPNAEASSTTDSVVAASSSDFTNDDLYTRLNNRLGNLAPQLNQQGLQLGISAVIDGNFHHDTAKDGLGEMKEEIAGFGHNHDEEDHHHHHHGDKNGFNLHHIELGLSAEVDPYFRAWATLAFDDEEEKTEIEEAVIQTTGLPYGLTLSAGKYMSGIGRINRQHSHVWDFMDAPLVYEKFFGSHGLREKGIQLTWKAPTPFYLLFGAEAGNGENEAFSNQIGGEHLPDHDAPRLYTTFVKFAPDLGDRHALQLGLSYVNARNQSLHEHEHDDGLEILALDGRNELYGADFVYKYAGFGEKGEGDFIFQGEYFLRNSNMRDREEHHTYTNRQDGYYLQGLYGFAPRWRAGLRWEQLGLTNHIEDAEEGNWNAGSSYRATAMVDWKLSEFSLLRFQCGRHNYATEEGREHAWEFGLQLQVSLGSHPAHDF